MKMYNQINQNASSASSAQNNSNIKDNLYLLGLIKACFCIDDVNYLDNVIKNELNGNLEKLKELLNDDRSDLSNLIFNGSINCIEYLASNDIIYIIVDKHAYLELIVNDGSNINELDDNLIKLDDLEENWHICEQIDNRYHFDLLEYPSITNKLYFRSDIPINSIFEGDNFLELKRN